MSQEKPSCCPNRFQSNDWEYLGDHGDDLFFWDLYWNKRTGEVGSHRDKNIVEVCSREKWAEEFPQSSLNTRKLLN